jgi:predicted RNase H-like HicB family nuclease
MVELSDIKKLVNRPYIIITSIDETTNGESIYFAKVLEIDGCFGQGFTSKEAINDLHNSMQDYFESLISDGLPVPDPMSISSTVNTNSQSSFVYRIEGNRYLQLKENEIVYDSFLIAQHE